MTATLSQAKRSPSARDQQAQIAIWDLPLRLFHWLLVLAIAVAFISSEEDSPLNQWHVLAGWVAGILIVFRLIWGFVGGEHSRFADFIRPSRITNHLSGIFRGSAERTLGHNPLGGISVLILLSLVALTVWTGAFGGEGTEDLHELVAWTLLAFIGLHIAAVVVMSVLQQENLVKAMITGKKSEERHLGGRNARRPTVIGFLVAILALAATIYAVLRYDPQAFTLRTAQAFEHRAGAVGSISQERTQEQDKD